MPGSEALLLGTLLLLLLAPGSVKSSKYAYTEIIVPRQLKSKDNFHMKADVSYILKVEGRYQIIHLRHINFIVPNMPVYSYNMKGDWIADYPYIQDDCYYSGYVEDIKDSQVVLCICNGLWGHLQMESLNYEIEPIENTPTFQHLIYRRVQEAHEPCGGILEEGDDWPGDSARSAAVYDGYPEGHNSESRAPVRYLEVYSVVDRSKALAQRQNETQLVRSILLVMASVHSIYLEIGLHIYLVGLELWTERDHIIIGKTLPETLREFQIYASYQLLRRLSFDHSNLITTQGHRLGLTTAEHYCQHNYASVSVIRSVGSLKSDADQIAHELGHSLGFFHDESGRPCACHCARNPGFCIMNSNYSMGACRRLSNCSRRVYYDLVRKPGKECLLNKPSKVFKILTCGNGVLDRGEDCDCGNDEDCKIQGCCQTNCKFRPGADCLDGLCCERCKYIPAGTMCRPITTECDLAEYCNGKMADCPPDVYKQDGTLCGRSASCYTGQCLNLQQHCMALFGNGAKLAPLSCFLEVNMRGDRSGNCGKEGSKFKKCAKEDALCGRLQCTNVNKIPRLPSGQAIVQSPVEETQCWGTEFHLTLDAYDIGSVKDGTACGDTKICINRSCTSLQALNYDCDLKRCNYRGVCNNQKNCHCTYGWAPPFCEGKGFGGSIDSGPPPVHKSNLAVTIAVVTLMGVAFVALLITAVLKRDQLRAWLAQPDVIQDLSEPEPMSEPEDAPDPTPEPEPEPREPPVKRTPSHRTSLTKCTPQPEPGLQPENPPQQEPKPQPEPKPQSEPKPEPRPQPRNPPKPEPRPQPQYPPKPDPRPQPQYPPKTEPRTQPQNPPKPEPKTVSQNPPQTQPPLRAPKPQSQYPIQPEPRPQPQNPPRSQHPPRAPRPQSQQRLQPEPRAQPQRDPQPHAEPAKIRKPAIKPSRSSS